MNQMQEPYTPIKDKNIRFRIPLYQRPYAWEEPQIEQLLDDLYQHKDKDKDYFIGILSVGQTDTDSDLYDLIDGQQRITTLMLIASVFKEDFKTDVEWDSFIKDRIDFYGRAEDANYIYHRKNENLCNPKLKNGVECIIAYLNKRKEEDIKSLSQYIYKHAAFFISILPEDYSIIDKNTQFVRLNNRGKQLEKTDILKMKFVNILQKNKTETELKDVETFIKEWNKISQLGCGEDNTEEDNTNEQCLKAILDSDINSNSPKNHEPFYESIVTFPEFLLIALSRYIAGKKSNGEEFDLINWDKGKLLEIFGFSGREDDKDIWDSEKTLSFMNKFLQPQYELFVKFFIRKNKNDNKYSFNITKEGNTYFSKDNSKKSELAVFQSYLYVSREPHLWMEKAFNLLEDKMQNPSDFLTELKKIDNKQWCNYVKKNINFSFGNINRYWFWRLDYYLWENRDSIKIYNRNLSNDEKGIISKYSFSANRSIEHFHPQNQDKQSDKWVEKDKDDYIDYFGNLAMISSSFNSSQSNDPMPLKIARLQDYQIKHEKLESIKMYLMYLMYLEANEEKEKEKEKWTLDKMKTHHNEMINILIESFPTEQEFNNLKSYLGERKVNDNSPTLK